MTTKGSQSNDGFSALFASRSLGRLLAAFMLEPQRRFYQRELERLTGAPLRQVQRDLGRLERSGLVTKTPSGNRSYYQAVDTHPAFNDLRRALLWAAVDEPPEDGLRASVGPPIAAATAPGGAEAAIRPLPATLSIDRKSVARFCRRWKIAQLALFGSVLREDFGSGSDIDVLVTFSPDARWTLFDHSDMQAGLAALFGRPVDLVNREALERSENWIRRRAILDSAQLLYAA